MVGVSSTITSLRVVVEDCLPNSPPITGIRLRPGNPDAPRSTPSLIRPAIITVSPLCTAAWVLTLRESMRTLPLLSAVVPGELTSCTRSRNTMPSRVIRGRTLRMMPVSRYWTWL